MQYHIVFRFYTEQEWTDCVWHLIFVDCGHKPTGRDRHERRWHIFCLKAKPLWIVFFFFFWVICTLMLCTYTYLLLHSRDWCSLVHFEHQILATKTQKASPLCSSEIWPDSLLCCVVFRGQAGRRGTCSCRCSVPALHHNKGNLNALLFYVHCCKILQGHCGPYKTESCQIHIEKARVWIERDGLFMLATLRGLLSKL